MEWKDRTLRRPNTLSIIGTIAIVLLIIPQASSQIAVSLSPVPHIQFLDSNGKPLANGCVSTFQAGTTTPAATYVDSTGTGQNTNPIILNAGGFADIWLPNAAFKFKVVSAGGVACASGTTQWTVDNISGVLGLLNLANTWTAANTFSLPVTITPNVNQLVFGTPSFQTTLNFPAPAGNIVINGPSVAGTLAEKNGDTFTSPTIITPVLNGTPTGTSLQGTDTKLLTSGTVAGTASPLCTDANGGATTVGCAPAAAATLGCTAFVPVTITNNNTQQNLQSCTIAANTLAQGSLLNVDVTGLESTASGQNIVIGVSLGGGTACTATIAAGVANNQPFNFVGKFFVLTSGAGGTANWSCEVFGPGAAVFGNGGVVGAPTIPINTTIGNTLQITVQMSVLNAGNSTTEQGLKAVVF